MVKNCSQCNKEIKVRPCRVKEYNYCSQKCHLVFAYKNGLLNGKNMIKNAHKAIKEKGHYKRDNTYLIVNNPATSDQARKKISKAKLENNYMRGRFGELNHTWTGGHTMYRGNNWDSLKLEIKKRDNNKCVGCGMSERVSFEIFGQPLQCDHIVPYKITRDNSLSNLQTLCCKCHGAKWASDLKLIRQHIYEK